MVYGQSACKQLAKTKLNDALKNADNYNTLWNLKLLPDHHSVLSVRL